MNTRRSKPILYPSIVCALLAFLLGRAAFVTPAYAAGITVNSSADTTADDGTCTLREAINNAFTDSQEFASAGECAAGGSGSDTITFDSALSGATIHLASTLEISKDLTIDGFSLASMITLSGDTDNNGTGDVRVFHTTSPDIFDRTITLDSIIVAKGYVVGEGGGLLVGDNTVVNVVNSLFSGNSATNGGALSVYGTANIIDSTLSGNSSASGAGGGGAILNSQILTIKNSTFSDNAADNYGGGGALFNTSPNTTISNSTFSGNTAGVGGAILTTNSLIIKNSTISGNSALTGGSLSIQGHTTNLSNTIIANSTGSDCVNAATIGTNLNNLIEDGSCSPTLSAEPTLGPLASNGGPTQTFALLANSPAIDAGDDATCNAAPVSDLDQRGTARPNGGHCDIGAYEYVDTTAPTVTAFTATSPSTSLNIPITAFTASDDAVLTGYKITETSTPPSAGAAGWTASAPTTYSVGSNGSYTLYPWAKDAAGHVSALLGSPASVTVDVSAPTAGGLVAANVTTGGGTTYSFTVSFSDNLAVDITSIDGGDIRVTGPGGFNQLATLVSVTPAGNGTPRTATYQITAPGGAWDTTDNGAYTISLEANQVVDTVGNPAGAASLGSFLVSLNYTVYLPLVR